jgi:integrase
VRYLSDEERMRLLAACHSSSNPRLYPLVVLALRTGARLGELLRLGWSDIDLARGQAIVQESKNGERRTLPLAAECLEVLHALGRVRRLGSDVVLATAGGQATFPRKAWEAALRQSEVRDFRFHDLRHSFASYLAMSGATMPEIAAAMGHKTLAMVKRYAHLSDSHVSAVVARAAERFPV